MHKGAVRVIDNGMAKLDIRAALNEQPGDRLKLRQQWAQTLEQYVTALGDLGLEAPDRQMQWLQEALVRYGQEMWDLIVGQVRVDDQVLVYLMRFLNQAPKQLWMDATTYAQVRHGMRGPMWGVESMAVLLKQGIQGTWRGVSLRTSRQITPGCVYPAFASDTCTPQGPFDPMRMLPLCILQDTHIQDLAPAPALGDLTALNEWLVRQVKGYVSLYRPEYKMALHLTQQLDTLERLVFESVFISWDRLCDGMRDSRPSTLEVGFQGLLGLLDETSGRALNVVPEGFSGEVFGLPVLVVEGLLQDQGRLCRDQNGIRSVDMVTAKSV